MNRRTPRGWFALGACAATMACGLGCRGESEPAGEAAESQPAKTIHKNLAPEEDPPSFEFPGSLRSKNESLNRFLDEFRGICERGEYDRYRLAVSRQIEPIQEGHFESIWHAVKHVRIELIKRLPELKELPSPAYAILAKVTLREEYVKEQADRLVIVVAFQEEGEWVFVPSPDERITRAMRSAYRRVEAERSGLFAESQPVASPPGASPPTGG